MLASSLETIIETVRLQASQITIDHSEDLPRRTLNELFSDSLHLALDQVGRGADPQEFRDHVVINLIVQADEEGYSVNEIRLFLQDISDDED